MIYDKTLEWMYTVCEMGNIRICLYAAQVDTHTYFQEKKLYFSGLWHKVINLLLTMRMTSSLLKPPEFPAVHPNR